SVQRSCRRGERSPLPTMAVFRQCSIRGSRTGAWRGCSVSGFGCWWKTHAVRRVNGQVHRALLPRVDNRHGGGGCIAGNNLRFQDTVLVRSASREPPSARCGIVLIFFTSIPEFRPDSNAWSARAVRALLFQFCDGACLRVRPHLQRTTCAICICSFAFACSRCPGSPVRLPLTTAIRFH